MLLHVNAFADVNLTFRYFALFTKCFLNHSFVTVLSRGLLDNNLGPLSICSVNNYSMYSNDSPKFVTQQSFSKNSCCLTGNLLLTAARS